MVKEIKNLSEETIAVPHRIFRYQKDLIKKEAKSLGVSEAGTLRLIINYYFKNK